MSLLKRLPERKLPALAVLLAVGWIASSVSGCTSERIYDSVPLVPINVSPSEESEIANDSSVTFVWQSSTGAQYYEFHIFNQQTKDINQYYRRNLQAGDVCQNGSCQLTLNVSLPEAADHAWRVRAVNNAGFSGWTRTRFDMVGAGSTRSSNNDGSGNSVVSRSAPSVPNPLQPLSGSTAKLDSLVDFVWSSAPQATSYDFHLFDSLNRTIVDELTDIPATTVCQIGENCQLTRKVQLPPSTNHAWRVRAVNNDGQSAWTRVEFTVER